MPSYIPPKKNTAFIFYISLISQADTKLFQTNPTLAAGDVKVSTDGAALANITTLPAVTPASSKLVKVTLSTSEMNGDNVSIIFSDAAGSEWCDRMINIQTSANQVDDIHTDTNEIQGKLPTNYIMGSSDQADHDSDLSNIETDTQDIQSRIPAALVGGRIDSNVGAVSGDATAADNLEQDYDGTGYDKANSTIGTASALTGHTVQTGDTYDLLTAADTELSAIPDTTGTIINKIKFLFQYFRNKKTLVKSTGVETIYKEDGTTALGTATLDDSDSDTFTKGEMS